MGSSDLEHLAPGDPDVLPSGQAASPRRLAQIVGTAVAGALAVVILGLVLALWGLGLTGKISQSTSEVLDLVKLGFALVAGVGGTVGLVLAYQRHLIAVEAGLRERAKETREDAKERREDTKLFNERFAKAAEQLASEQYAVTLAGVYAMASLADDWDDGRQTCINVLCANLRRSYSPRPPDDADPAERLAFQDNQEVRHAIIAVIATRLRDQTNPWHGHNFDFHATCFDGGDFTGAVFSGGNVNFTGAVFTAGDVNFTGAVFSGANVNFGAARFTGGAANFGSATFTGGTVYFTGAVFAGTNVYFGGAAFAGTHMYFGSTTFSGGHVSFIGATFSGGYTNFARATFTGGTVLFSGAKFNGGIVAFTEAVFSGSTVVFTEAEFTGGTMDFADAEFTGSAVGFADAVFSGGTVDFTSTTFSGGDVDFDLATFSGSTVDFGKAEFSGSIVKFEHVSDWSMPPQFAFAGKAAPAGVTLPTAGATPTAD